MSFSFFAAPLALTGTVSLKGTSMMVMREGQALLFHFPRPAVYSDRVLGYLLLSSVSSQDVKNRRNPRLVPYTLLDERTKKSNKDSLREAVRTLLGYGYNLEAPDQDHGTIPTLLCVASFDVILGRF